MSDTVVEVLRKASHEQLKPLIEYLDRPRDMAVKKKDAYRVAVNDLSKIPTFIEQHIRLAGGHTLINWARRMEGPPYCKVVADVCKALKVKVVKNDDAAAMEFKLISALFKRRWAKMTEAERAEFVYDFKLQTGFDGKLVKGMSFAALAAALGPTLLATATADFAVGLGWALAKTILGEIMPGVTLGPVGALAAAGVVLANQALGPSQSATVPCVLHIASLRMQQKIDDTLGEPL